MRFRFIDAQSASMPVARLCAFMGVSCSGYYAWRKRSASARQREDMALLAHVKDRFGDKRPQSGAGDTHLS